MIFSNVALYLRLKWLKVLRRLGLGCTGGGFFIGGAGTPSPASARGRRTCLAAGRR